MRPQEVMRAPIPTGDWLRMRKALPHELRDKVSEFDQNKAARHPQNLLQIAMQVGTRGRPGPRADVCECVRVGADLWVCFSSCRVVCL